MIIQYGIRRTIKRASCWQAPPTSCIPVAAPAARFTARCTARRKTMASCAASPPRRPVFFLHVSSSGGSSLCALAQSQPCARVPSCGANCNLQCAHPWDWRQHCTAPACAPPAKPCRPPYKPGCAGLSRYVRRRNLSFVASETLLAHGLCPEFAYVAVVRDPVARLQSQLERMSATPNHRLHAMMARPRVFNASETTSLMGTAAVDNYLTRLLLGPSAFFLPLRGINASHALAASRVLARFAAVIPLEDLGGAGARLLQQKVGRVPAANERAQRRGRRRQRRRRQSRWRRRRLARQALGARSAHGAAQPLRHWPARAGGRELRPRGGGRLQCATGRHRPPRA